MSQLFMIAFLQAKMDYLERGSNHLTEVQDITIYRKLSKDWKKFLENYHSIPENPDPHLLIDIVIEKTTTLLDSFPRFEKAYDHFNSRIQYLNLCESYSADTQPDSANDQALITYPSTKRDGSPDIQPDLANYQTIHEELPSLTIQAVNLWQSLKEPYRDLDEIVEFSKDEHVPYLYKIFHYTNHPRLKELDNFLQFHSKTFIVSPEISIDRTFELFENYLNTTRDDALSKILSLIDDYNKERQRTVKLLEEYKQGRVSAKKQEKSERKILFKDIISQFNEQEKIYNNAIAKINFLAVHIPNSEVLEECESIFFNKFNLYMELSLNKHRQECNQILLDFPHNTEIYKLLSDTVNNSENGLKKNIVFNEERLGYKDKALPIVIFISILLIILAFYIIDQYFKYNL